MVIHKKIKNKISELNVLISLLYVSKYLNKIDNYKLFKNPYGADNKFLKTITQQIIKSAKILDKNYPQSAKFVDELYQDMWDIYEELFYNLNMYKKNKLNNNSNPVQINLIDLFSLINNNLNSSKQNDTFEYIIYLDIRLKEINKKIENARSKILNVIIIIYLLYYKKSNSNLLKTSEFKNELDRFISEHSAKVKADFLTNSNFIQFPGNKNLFLPEQKNIKINYKKAYSNLSINLTIFFNLFLSESNKNKGINTNAYASSQGILRLIKDIHKQTKNKKTLNLLINLMFILKRAEQCSNQILKMRRSIYSIINHFTPKDIIQ